MLIILLTPFWFHYLYYYIIKTFKNVQVHIYALEQNSTSEEHI